MLLGMTRGEIGLVIFIFGLIYSAQLVPRLGELLGELLAGGAGVAGKTRKTPDETRRGKP